MINEEIRREIVEKVKPLLPEIKQAEKKKLEAQAWFEKVGNIFKTPEVEEMMKNNATLIDVQMDVNIERWCSRNSIAKHLSVKIISENCDDYGDLYIFELQKFNFPKFIVNESDFKSTFGDTLYVEEIEKFKKKYGYLQKEGKALLEDLIKTRNKATKKIQHLWKLISREDLTLIKLKTYCPTLYDLYKK